MQGNIYTEQNILSTEGRIRRSTFWTRWLIIFFINIMLRVLMNEAPQELIILIVLVSICLSIFVIIQGVKRMHDLNKSGWYFLIPFYNIVLACTDGTPGPNDYGDDPKGRQPLPGDILSGDVIDAFGNVSSNVSVKSISDSKNDAKSDQLIVIYLGYAVFAALIRFIMYRFGNYGYEGGTKYFFVGLNLIYGVMPLLLALAIKNEKIRIVGIILAVLYGLHIWYDNIIWMIN